MSRLMSSIAVRWSGVSTNGNASSISACHGVSWANEWPSRVDPLLVEHDEFLGDLAHGRADAALRLGEVRSAEAVQRRRLATDVLAQCVDLVARHVELVAALVRDEQVVAFDAADVALDHALVLADAVLVVDDVVAGLQVLERAGAVAALARPGGAVGPSPAGEVALGDDRHLRVRQRAAAVERRHDDRSAGLERTVVRSRRRPGSRGRCRAAARAGVPLNRCRRRRRRPGSRDRSARPAGR